MTVNLPKQLLEIFDKLCSHGYKTYIYGKCLRLSLKGQNILDFDVLTNADMPRVRAIFDVPGTESGDELLVRVLGVAANIRSYNDLKSELIKNTLTIDALAYNPDGGFEDFFGGLKHNEQNIIAFTDKAADIFSALALYSSGEYAVSPESKEKILKSADITGFDREIFEEILMGKKGGEVLKEYETVFKVVIEELKMFDPAEFSDLLTVTFKSVSCSSPVLPLRYALFFSEFGKPDCYAADSDGIASYYGHIERSRIYADRILKRMGYNDEQRGEVCFIIENREKVADADEKNVRGFLSDYTSERLKMLLLFHQAVIRAKQPKNERDSLKFKRMASLIL